MTEATYLTSTRTAYDTVAVSYAELLRDDLDRMPWDRAVLATFAELVASNGAGPVADIGCGPGRVTAYLDSLGAQAFGIDLSPGMVEVARQHHPKLRFTEGSMLALESADGELAGVVAWYSIIHLPPEQLPLAFAEFHRVLVAEGQLVLAFQVGEQEPRHIEQAYGHQVAMDAYRFSPDWISELLRAAGFVVHARLIREPYGSYEKSPQAYLFARKG